ncbi:MAG: FCD domain-containing protein [Paracoccaceae bacterium]
MQMRGYVTAEAGHRPRAAKPSLEATLRAAGSTLRDILGDEESAVHLEQMRQFIETGAAREAASKADNLQLTKLRAALDRNFEAIGSARFAETDIAFHRVLLGGRQPRGSSRCTTCS